jgi:uncharacterized protein YjbI with pentapeptide repeats
MTIEIKHRATKAVLHTIKSDSLRGASLSGASLSDASLSDADLRGAYLSGAYLSGAYLRDADLSGAYLSRADLSDADLRGASLRGAYLRDADLRGAYLRDADLSGASLRGAYLRDADLSGASLRDVHSDFVAVLAASPAEVPALREALVSGKIDGNLYEGECACLIGTIANARKCDYRALGTDLEPDSSRPAERWFLAITPGLPVTHPVVAITIAWIDAWTAAQ